MPICAEDAEESVIKTILNFGYKDNFIMEKALSIIKEDDFYNPQYGLIYGAMRDLFDNGIGINLTTVVNNLREKGKLDSVGGTSAVSGFMLNVNWVQPESITWYCNIVKDKSLKREILSKQEALIHNLHNFSNEELEKKLSEQIELAREIPGKITRMHDMAEAVEVTEKKIFEQIEKGQKIAGYSTGFYQFDYVTSGVEPGLFYVYAAETSKGKSTLALNIAVNLLKQNIPVLYFIYEMPMMQIIKRIIASELQIQANKLRSGNLDESEQELIRERSKILKEYPLKIIDDYQLKIVEMEKIIHQFKMNHQEFVVFVDYLQLVKGGEGDTTREKVSSIARSLLSFAGKYNIPVIALSQFSRSIAHRGDRARPKLSDLKESSEIEQAADTVVLIHATDNEMEQEMPTMNIDVAKQRYGEIGNFNLKFKRKFVRFENHGGYYDPGNP